MNMLRSAVIYNVIAVCLCACSAAPTKPQTPIESYLTRADGYAGLTIAYGEFGKDVANRHDSAMTIDHADFIEKLRPAYNSALAFAPADSALLAEHWTKFNQCMTLGSTTEELAQACKYELGAIRARITTK